MHYGNVSGIAIVTSASELMMPLDVHVCQQCIVRGLELGLGLGQENKGRSKGDQRHY